MKISAEELPLPTNVPDAYGLFVDYLDERLAAIDAEFAASDDYEVRHRLGRESWRIVLLREALSTFVLRLLRLAAGGTNTMH